MIKIRMPLFLVRHRIVKDASCYLGNEQLFGMLHIKDPLLLIGEEGRKRLFNDALNTFYLR